MKRNGIICILISLLVSINLNAGTSSNKVAVLYNTKTQINRNALHFMGGEFKNLGVGYEFETFDNGSDIKPGIYKSVIILNTGVEAGIDPILNSFIDKWKIKSELIIVSLYKGSSDFSVKAQPVEVNDISVDSVTSASIWRKPLFSSIPVSNSEIKDMHNNWVKEIVNIIDKK